MASLNNCTFIGNLGRDPELKFLPSGDAVCSISIAVSSKWKDKNTGEQKEHTEWIPLEFFGKLAEIAGQYLKKGSSIYVSGRFSTRKYTDKDGVEKYATSVKVDQMQMLGGKQEGGGAPAPAQRPAQAPAQRPAAGGKPASNFSDMDEDIPFAFDNTLLSVHTTSSQMMRAKHGRGMSLVRENQIEF